MFIFGNLLISFAKVLSLLLTVMYWLIIIRALISWVNPDPFNPIVEFLNRVTEPVLEPIRRRLPVMAIDISPIIAFLFIIFLQSFLVQTLIDMGLRFKGF